MKDFVSIPESSPILTLAGTSPVTMLIRELKNKRVGYMLCWQLEEMKRENFVHSKRIISWISVFDIQCLYPSIPLAKHFSMVFLETFPKWLQTSTNIKEFRGILNIKTTNLSQIGWKVNQNVYLTQAFLNNNWIIYFKVFSLDCLTGSLLDVCYCVEINMYFPRLCQKCSLKSPSVETLS